MTLAQHWKIMLHWTLPMKCIRENLTYVGTKNHGPFSNCDWTAALFWCMFWRVSIRHISGLWNVQSSCWSFYNFTTFWGPTRLFPTKKCIVNQVQESLQRLKMGYPSFEWKLWSTYFSPCFLWCFYIRLRFSQIHGLISRSFKFLHRPLIRP